MSAKKRRYIFLVVEYTINYPNPNVPPERVKALISTCDWVKAHWGASPSYTLFAHLDNMSVLKVYGTPQNEDETDAILRQYQLDYPPDPYDIESALVKDVDGWLSPDGQFYRSGYMGHSNLALDLAVGILKLEDESDYSYDDALYRAGWIGIGHIVFTSGMYDFDTAPTEAQKVWIKRLRELNAGFESYVNCIDRFLRQADMQVNRE